MRIRIILLSLIISVLFSNYCFASVVKQVPVSSEFKTFMGYRAITDKSSKQWELQTQATTDSNGLRVLDGRYLIAIGSYFTKTIGTKLDVRLDNGTVLPCIVGDTKADIHTINNHSTGTHNDAIEFIVDMYALNPVAKNRGDISYIPGFEGAVTSIEIITDTDEEAISDIIESLSEAPVEEPNIEQEDSECISIAIVTKREIAVNVLEELKE